MAAPVDEGADAAPEPSEPRARDLLATPGAIRFDPSSRWEHALSVAPELPRFVKEEMPSWLEPADWGAGFLAVHEREPPPDLFSDLRQCVPQAYLRDLHRLVMGFAATLAPVEGSHRINAWDEALAEARAARVREPLPVIAPSVEAVREEQERRRALLAEVWKPILDDDAPRRQVAVWTAPQ